jgi:putative phosphonate catabolism associated alcohol dehydrogenase
VAGRTSPVTARAAVFDGPGLPFRIVERPLPRRLEAGAVLVEVSLATVCGSDLHTHAGRRQGPVPAVLGHEGVGHVVAAGAGREPWLGRRVTWSLADSCGRCPACTAWALPQKCAQLFKYGHAPLQEGDGLHGTYATHVVLRAGTHLVEVPPHLSDAVAAPANCAVATMVHLTEQLPASVSLAVVQGAGLLGLLGCALLRAAGVPRVLVVDVDEARQATVARFGGEAVRSEALPTQCADLVIEAAGVPEVVPEGVRLLRPGGHYLLAGMVHPASALALTGEALIRGCVTLRGFHNYAPPHLDGAVAFLRDSTLPWDTLVSAPLPLSAIDEAFALAGTRRWARVAVAPGLP